MEKGPAYGNYGYHYRYYKSEEAGTKKHVIEPENIGVFDYVNEMDIRLQAYNKPDGSRRFPAKSCKELKECYPEMPSGELSLIVYVRECTSIYTYFFIKEHQILVLRVSQGIVIFIYECFLRDSSFDILF